MYLTNSILPFKAHTLWFKKLLGVATKSILTIIFAQLKSSVIVNEFLIKEKIKLVESFSYLYNRRRLKNDFVLFDKVI